MIEFMERDDPRFLSTAPTVVIKGAAYDRIVYGAEPRPAGLPALVWPPKKCWDCGQPNGKVHGFGCDTEACPVCHGQLLSCDCGPVEVADR